MREISGQWDEEAHTFLNRPAMMEWDGFNGCYLVREDIVYKMQLKCSVLAVRPFMLQKMQLIGVKTGEDDDLTGLW